MKELEALERIMLFIAGVSDTLSVDEGKQLEKDIIIIGTYLTPPTSEEVCKALSKELGHYRVDYDREKRMFKGYIPIAYPSQFGDDGIVIASLSLPPHLITLIGRFYQGVKE